LIRKLAYSLGAIATSLSYQTFSTYIIFFYVDVLKLPIQMAGIAMLIYAGWNAINDPLAGYLSDITRSRFGRRIPYIALGGIPLGLVFFLLWIPPFTGMGQELSLFIYFLSMICLFDAFYSVAAINWTALYPEMFSSIEERTQVNSFRQTFVMIGLLAGVSLPPMIYNYLGWSKLGMIFGAVISLAMIIALLGSREKNQFSADPPLAPWKALKATLTRRSFLLFSAANFFVQVTFITVLATIPFYAKYVLGAGPLLITQLLLTGMLAAIGALFVWRRITVKIGLKTSFLIIALLQIGFFLLLLFAGTLALVFLATLLIGTGIAGFNLLSDIFVSDIVDEDETITGTRREGVFFGIGAFINRFAIMLETFAMSTVFILSGYSPYVHSQSSFFQSGLKFLIAGLPIVALMAAFAIMWFYPLAGDELARMRGRLAEIHQQKGVR
jgi:GPH family glycoside/pentoside/hexuronide:cation symporter